jgi:hypothetical protein
MARLAASQVVPFPSRALVPESIESLREKCAAAEESATAAVAEDQPAYAELVRTRQVFQQMLDAMSLDILQLKRELQARDQASVDQPSDSGQPSAQPQRVARGIDDEISFDEIDALLAATPLES